MRTNVNEIRLPAWLFDKRLFVITWIGRAALTKSLPSSPMQSERSDDVARTLPRKKKLNPISMLVLTLMLIAVGPARGQDAAVPVGNSDAGATVFKKCMACHQIGPHAQNGIGPVLNGVIGRPAGQYPHYSYSSANKNSGLVWDERTLSAYLRAPAKVVPGTRMIFAGLKNGQEVSDVIAYLKEFAADGKRSIP
jgi:cytochrome c